MIVMKEIYFIELHQNDVIEIKKVTLFGVRKYVMCPHHLRVLLTLVYVEISILRNSNPHSI